MRRFLPINCDSQKVACSLSILVLVLLSLLGDFRYGRYQLYRSAAISAMFSWRLCQKWRGVASSWLPAVAGDAQR